MRVCQYCRDILQKKEDVIKFVCLLLRRSILYITATLKRYAPFSLKISQFFRIVAWNTQYASSLEPLY